MSPHEDELKNDVGVRELRDNLSRYVEYVAEGNEVAVTVRGRAVARLVPNEGRRPFEALLARGAVALPTLPRTEPFPVPDRPLLKPGSPPSHEFVRKWR